MDYSKEWEMRSDEFLAILGEDWQVRQTDFSMYIQKKSSGFGFAISNHKKFTDKLSVSGTFLRDQFKYSRRDDKWPIITIAKDASAEQIINAVVSRLFPKYMPIFTYTLSKLINNTKYLQRQLANLTMLGELIGESVNDCGDTLYYSKADDSTCKIKMDDDVSAEITFSRTPIELAKRILREYIYESSEIEQAMGVE